MLRLLGFKTVVLDRLFLDPMPKRPLAITFDDGYENFRTNALPALESSGFRAAVFVVSNLIGDVNRWDSDRGDVVEPLMDARTLQEIQSRGTLIGSHTMTHVDLAAVDEDTARQEIEGSKERLEEVLGREVDTFCYPYGRKTQRTVEMVAAAGYRFACSTLGGVNSSETNPLLLRRVNVRRDTTPAILLFKLFRDFRRGPS